MAGALGASQGVDLLEIFEKAYVRRDIYLRHETVLESVCVVDQPK